MLLGAVAGIVPFVAALEAGVVPGVRPLGLGNVSSVAPPSSPVVGVSSAAQVHEDWLVVHGGWRGRRVELGVSSPALSLLLLSLLLSSPPFLVALAHWLASGLELAK